MSTKNPELLKAAAEHVADYGSAEYKRGFRTALTLAELSLRFLRTSGSMSEVKMVSALAKSICDACADAGVDLPTVALRDSEEVF